MAMSALIIESILLAAIYGGFNPPMVQRNVRAWIWVAMTLAMVRARATVSGADPSWWGVLIWWHLVAAAAGLILATFAAVLRTERQTR